MRERDQCVNTWLSLRDNEDICAIRLIFFIQPFIQPNIHSVGEGVSSEPGVAGLWGPGGEAPQANQGKQPLLYPHICLILNDMFVRAQVCEGFLCCLFQEMFEFDLFQYNDTIYHVDYRPIGEDVSLEQNAFQTAEFKPNGNTSAKWPLYGIKPLLLFYVLRTWTNLFWK